MHLSPPRLANRPEAAPADRGHPPAAFKEQLLLPAAPSTDGPRLLPEIWSRISALLPHNEAVCTLRLVCKDALAASTTTPSTLHAPVPPHATSSPAAHCSLQTAATVYPISPPAPQATSTPAACPSEHTARLPALTPPRPTSLPTVRLSQPVPPHAFASHWGGCCSSSLHPNDPGPCSPSPSATPNPWHQLTHTQRLRLLCFTASTGVLPNLQLAVKASGCVATAEVLAAAAASGQLPACRWLRDQAGCDWAANGRCRERSRAMEAAARAGHAHVVRWLREAGCRPGAGTEALLAAAAGAHREVCEYLLCPDAAPSAGSGKGVTPASAAGAAVGAVADGGGSCGAQGSAGVDEDSSVGQGTSPETDEEYGWVLHGVRQCGLPFLAALAGGGHARHVEWALRQPRLSRPLYDRSTAGGLLVGAAAGCGLAALQGVHGAFLAAAQREVELHVQVCISIGAWDNILALCGGGLTWQAWCAMLS